MRPTCPRCRKAQRTCYCHVLRPFTPPVDFVILQHYDEARNAIATARMAHLTLNDSRLLMDNHFGGDPRVDALIARTDVRNVLLYPGRDAEPLAAVIAAPDPRPPVFWVLDAKWSKVPKMLRLSPNVRALPMASFTPERASGFQPVRRQPAPACVSTIEAIHQVIDQVLRFRGDPSRAHDALLEVFQHFVRQQIDFVNPHDQRHAAARERRAARMSKCAPSP
jgi:DTW domain-containing protein YfiP